MISHQDKCIFVHVPKVAGQSIESVFVERAGLTWPEREALLLRPNSEPTLGPPRLAHLLASEYVSLGYLAQPTFDEYFKFSFVRNPYARLVSEFNYRKQLGHEGYLGSFREFVLNHFPTPDKDNYTLARDHYRHILPQVDFLYDEQGRCLVDFIGRFEQLQHDFAVVCSQLNIESITLSHKNKTTLKTPNKLVGLFRRLASMSNKKGRVNAVHPSVKCHYSKYYDDETRAFVSHFYQADLKAFNYKFEQRD